MKLRDYLHFVSNAPTLEDLWATHTEKMAEYGFDRLIYGFTQFRTETSLGDPEDFVILSNHPPANTEGCVMGGPDSIGCCSEEWFKGSCLVHFFFL